MLRRREKKKRAGDEGTGYPSERVERVDAVGGRAGGREAERRSTYADTYAAFSRSFLRSFVRFFVMTVDETMTYFSGFSLPGCPAALPFTPSSSFPLPPLPPLPPPPPSSGTRMHARVHAASGASVFFHCTPESRIFSFLCVAHYSPPAARAPRA